MEQDKLMQRQEHPNISHRSDGTLFEPRKKLPWPDDQDFRILSIDGGGIKGILPAALLANFEDDRTAEKFTAGSYFDMIAGTSTGGIIALGLATGISAKTILDIYLEKGTAIFPPKPYSSNKRIAKVQKFLDFPKKASRYQYERDELARGLEKVFGEKRLEHSLRRLVIPAFDGYTEVHLFKTPHHPDFKLDWQESLVDVALATSAAPTFFSVYKSGDRRFVDGGVWANNPIMNAVVDALTCYDITPRQIKILSLGCGETEYKISQSMEVGGLWHWREIISGAIRLQSQNAIGQAGLLIGRDQLVRIDSSDVTMAMDDSVRAINELPNLARKLASEFYSSVTHFFDNERQPFDSYYGVRAG